MIEHVQLFLLFVFVCSLFYLFCWWMPKKIANSKPGELEDWPDIKKRLKNKKTLFVILYFIIIAALFIMVHDAWVKSKDVDKELEELVKIKSISTKDNQLFVVCSTYDGLNQLDENQKNIAYVRAPKDKSGMYIWIPNENKWILVTK